MPPDSLGTPLHAGVTHREHLQCTTSLRERPASYRVSGVRRHHASRASTGGEMKTRYVCAGAARNYRGTINFTVSAHLAQPTSLEVWGVTYRWNELGMARDNPP